MGYQDEHNEHQCSPLHVAVAANTAALRMNPAAGKDMICNAYRNIDGILMNTMNINAVLNKCCCWHQTCTPTREGM